MKRSEPNLTCLGKLKATTCCVFLRGRVSAWVSYVVMERVCCMMPSPHMALQGPWRQPAVPAGGL